MGETIAIWNRDGGLSVRFIVTLSNDYPPETLDLPHNLLVIYDVAWHHFPGDGGINTLYRG